MDDQSFNIDALLIILSSVHGIDTSKMCATALNGQEAIAKVKESVALHQGRECGFDLLLMDCNMPFIDGYEATTQIREYLLQRRIDQPVITAVTGHTESMYVDRAIEAGMN